MLTFDKVRANLELTAILSVSDSDAQLPYAVHYRRTQKIHCREKRGNFVAIPVLLATADCYCADMDKGGVL